MSGQLVEHYFRHEYGRLVAALLRRVGAQHWQAVEDAVQEALVAAMESWPRAGLPDNPSAWLARVARNELIGRLRQNSLRQRLLDQAAPVDLSPAVAQSATFLSSELPDDLLRLLFVCCDPAIPAESQLVLALKTLCGFDVTEIAQRLFLTPANVYKRLARARQRLRETQPDCDQIAVAEYELRLPAVRRIVYLMFTEGHLSNHTQFAIRRELCDEAIRLATLLAEHPLGRSPESAALVALMHLHASRLDARVDAGGALLLLQDQDRSRWNQQQIRIGLSWLARSACGPNYSRYHAEAAIAAEHCMAPSFEQTDWEKVAASYALLEQVAPSPIHRLNRAVAVAQAQGPAAGLAVLDDFEPPLWLSTSYMWFAVQADLYRRCGNRQKAVMFGDRACESAPNSAVRTLLAHRLQCGSAVHRVSAQSQTR